MQGMLGFCRHTVCRSLGRVLPARAPDTVPFPWQLSTRTSFTDVSRATPESNPLTTPAMCVPWLSHWLLCTGETVGWRRVETQMSCCKNLRFRPCQTCLWFLTPSSSGMLLKSVITTRPSISLWESWTWPSIKNTSAVRPSSTGDRKSLLIYRLFNV